MPTVVTLNFIYMHPQYLLLSQILPFIILDCHICNYIASGREL